MKKNHLFLLTFLLTSCTGSNFDSFSTNTNSSSNMNQEITSSLFENSSSSQIDHMNSNEDSLDEHITSSEIQENISSNSSSNIEVETGYSAYVPQKYITSQAEVDNYYVNIQDSMFGETLKNALSSLISKHTKMNYDDLEDYMNITDRNWQLSPLESDKNPYMNLLYYTQNDNENNRQTWDKYHSSNNPGNPQMWDKEHIWAKSNGFPSKGKMAYSDLHHLRASDMKNNNTRSNLPFGEVQSESKNVFDFSSTVSGKTGLCKNVKVYEPRDEDKGDVARAIFYMATCYADYDGIKLALTDGTDSSNSKWGFVSTLLKWNEQDLPDEFEIRRNDIVYQAYQHNRNPFIDHPEYANRIYK